LLTPVFSAMSPLCTTETAPVLPPDSDNGIAGTWNPSTIDMTLIGTTAYEFIPNNPCSSNYSLDVTIVNSTLPTFNPIANICQGQTAPALPNPSLEGITGTWLPTTIDSSLSGTETYTFTPDAGQCAEVSTINVTITPTPVAEFISDDSVCQGSFYTFPALAVGSYYSGSGSTGTSYAPADDVVINTTQTFYVYVSNGTAPNNCVDETSFIITAVDSPVVSLSGGCVANVYTINASLSNGSSATYAWTGPSGTLSETGSSITVNQDGEYSCVATTTLANNSECESQAVVFAANGTLCVIQKGISPNGDGSNDNFDLTGLNVRKLEIFNRYGKKVYSFSNYTNQWYGQSDNGNDLPTGTYYYVIERDNVASKSGWIYINR
jgi:gliding motility-associated-like protein